MFHFVSLEAKMPTLFCAPDHDQIKNKVLLILKLIFIPCGQNKIKLYESKIAIKV